MVRPGSFTGQLGRPPATLRQKAVDAAAGSRAPAFLIACVREHVSELIMRRAVGLVWVGPSVVGVGRRRVRGSGGGS
jgi:hypothetical protein